MLTHSITMLVPEAEVKSAAKIFRSLDPDTGGILSFGPPDKKGMCYASMPCTEEEAARFDRMMAEPAKLEEFLEKDYAKRWVPSPEVLAEATKDPVKLEAIQKLDYSKVTSLKATADITTVDKEAILAKYDPDVKIGVAVVGDIVEGGK